MEARPKTSRHGRPSPRARGVLFSARGRHLVCLGAKSSPAGILFQLHPGAADRLDGCLQRVDRRVEVLLGCLECGLLGLPYLVGDALVLGFEIGVASCLVVHDRGVLLILPGVGCDISQDVELGDVWVVFRIDALQLRMQGFIACSRKTGISLVDLDVGISFLEVGEADPERTASAVLIHISDMS